MNERLATLSIAHNGAWINVQLSTVNAKLLINRQYDIPTANYLDAVMRKMGVKVVVNYSRSMAVAVYMLPDGEYTAEQEECLNQIWQALEFTMSPAELENERPH